jgi:hypothetical protein
MTASTALEGSWLWANQTIMDNTEGQVMFHQITEYRSLIGIKNGSGSSHKNGIVITGVIDSFHNPGANDLGASVAAVLEIARVLHSYDFAIDVYYVLVNRGTASTTYDLGSRAFVTWLENNGIKTIMAFTFDRLLFNRPGFIFSRLISLRSYSHGSYQRTSWLPDLMIHLSSQYGASRLNSVPDTEGAQLSCTYEMWQVGRPAIHVSQGFWPDPHSSTDQDTWDHPDYSYPKAAEALASVASVTAYLGMLGKGNPPAQYKEGDLSFNTNVSRDILINSKCYLNATVSWDGNKSIVANIVDESGQIVYQRTESDGLIIMKYLVQHHGIYQVASTYLGDDTSIVRMNITYIEDSDGDGLSDILELDLGLSVYSIDTDNDGLSDGFEYNLGTDPLSSDSDGDGAPDGEEYNAGSSLLLFDTDDDGISDGDEVDFGTDPTNQDTDSDGLNDFQEIFEFHTDPTNSDTDADGLDDGFETEAGLNPLSPDTDGDTLSDLFEILNLMNPLLSDTDGDGWGDSYEVEFCLSPTDADTDNDGIPDGLDWDPREHWLSVITPVSLISIILLIMIYSFMKFRVYQKRE